MIQTPPVARFDGEDMVILFLICCALMGRIHGSLRWKPAGSLHLQFFLLFFIYNLLLFLMQWTSNLALEIGHW